MENIGGPSTSDPNRFNPIVGNDIPQQKEKNEISASESVTHKVSEFAKEVISKETFPSSTNVHEHEIKNSSLGESKESRLDGIYDRSTDPRTNNNENEIEGQIAKTVFEGVISVNTDKTVGELLVQLGKPKETNDFTNEKHTFTDWTEDSR